MAASDPTVLCEVFNNSQHVSTSDQALLQLKKIYKNSKPAKFEGQLRDCVRKLLQSKQSIYFKTSCDFLCKFLKHLTQLSDDVKTNDGDIKTAENVDPNSKIRRSRSAAAPDPAIQPPAKRGRKPAATGKRAGRSRKNDTPDDELASMLSCTSSNLTQNDVTNNNDSSSEADSMVNETTVLSKRMSTANLAQTEHIITSHDRVISACVDILDLYMQVADEDCRLNAVYLVGRFLSSIESVDEEICNALKNTLPKRIRDRKPVIRAQAVLASRTFQDAKMIQEGFLHHFYRDPELVVRKALLQIMDIKIFGYDFLVDSTQDVHETMRKSAFQRLGKIDPNDLTPKQLQKVMHNGLIERERQASYAFKSQTLNQWLSKLYDGTDLYKLLNSFDVIESQDDVNLLLRVLHEQDLEKLVNNGTSTHLHHVVERFREKWLGVEGKCLPSVGQIDDKVVCVWLSLIKFCKSNQALIKRVKVKTITTDANTTKTNDANTSQRANPDESIEEILDSQGKGDYELIDLYERLMPDLVNLVDFIKSYVQFCYEKTKRLDDEGKQVENLEFVYQKLMSFVSEYEIGDELERKTVQEVFGILLKQNLLTGKFTNFIPPIVSSLHKLVYASSSNLMINYISEMIQNVRSHLEDLATSNQAPGHLQKTALLHSAILRDPKTPKSVKKVRINSQPSNRKSLNALVQDEQNLEFKIATIRVDLEELRDKLEDCIKQKDFDQAKTINNKISDMQAELALLHNRRSSIASDVSHMSMVIDNDPTGQVKLSSTMIGDASFEGNETLQGDQDHNVTQIPKDPHTELKAFRHHTNELIKCLQMYFGCLQCVKLPKVPQTMLAHLNHLSYECLDDYFKSDCKVVSLMVACNGLTALLDKDFAAQPSIATLLIAACSDNKYNEIRTIGFKSFVDIACLYDELDLPMNKIERFLRANLREYGKYDPNNVSKSDLEYITTMVEGTTKLYYFQKLDSPKVFAHLILWWYHPRTPSKIKQFIGIFLPTFVKDISLKLKGTTDNWLKELLEDTFVMSIESLHDYIRGPGYNIMYASDMLSLINFLCSLVPISFHSSIKDKVDDKISDVSASSPDLVKYLRQSKNTLNIVAASSIQETCSPLT